MAQSVIVTVEMLRHIRDRRHDLLKENSPEEGTALYEAKAKKAMERARRLLQERSGDGAK